MANRRYSQFSERRPKADEPQPSPGTGSGGKPMYASETTANWPGAPDDEGGPTLRSQGGMNRKTQFPEVKAYAAQDMADDKSMKLGGGGRFAALAAKAKASGAKNPAAVAAAAGIAAHGTKKMTKWSVAGRKRAAKKG